VRGEGEGRARTNIKKGETARTSRSTPWKKEKFSSDQTKGVQQIYTNLIRKKIPRKSTGEKKRGKKLHDYIGGEGKDHTLLHPETAKGREGIRQRLTKGKPNGTPGGESLPSHPKTEKGKGRSTLRKEKKNRTSLLHAVREKGCSCAGPRKGSEEKKTSPNKLKKKNEKTWNASPENKKGSLSHGGRRGARRKEKRGAGFTYSEKEFPPRDGAKPAAGCAMKFDTQR